MNLYRRGERVLAVVGGTLCNAAAGMAFHAGDDGRAWLLTVTAALVMASVAAGIAADRGRSRWWAVAGLFGLLGLAVVLLLRDRQRDLIDGWPEDQSAHAAGVRRVDPWDPGLLSPGPQHRAG